MSNIDFEQTYQSFENQYMYSDQLLPSPQVPKAHYKLQRIEQGLQNIASYGISCDELFSWLSNNSFDKADLEKSLLKCLLIVREKAPSFGIWSGSRILNKVNESSGMLSSETQTTIKELCEELRNLIKKDISVDQVSIELGNLKNPTNVSKGDTPSSPLPEAAFTEITQINSQRPNDETRRSEHGSKSSSLSKTPETPVVDPPAEVLPLTLQSSTGVAINSTRNNTSLSQSLDNPQTASPTHTWPRTESEASDATNTNRNTIPVYTQVTAQPTIPIQPTVYVQNYPAMYNLPYPNIPWTHYMQSLYYGENTSVNQNIHPNTQYNTHQLTYHYPQQSFQPNASQIAAPYEMSQQSNYYYYFPNGGHNPINYVSHVSQAAQPKQITPNESPAAEQAPHAESSSCPSTLGKPNPKGPAQSIPKEELGPQDLAVYPKKVSYLIEPFNLVHGERVMKKSFHLPRDEYEKMYSNRNTYVKDLQTFPLAFVFTAWHIKSTKKMCWPEEIRASFNGRRLRLEKKTLVRGRTDVFTGTDRPFNLKGTIKEGENTLKIYQDGCACSFGFCVQVYALESERCIENKVKSRLLSIDSGKDLIDKLLGNKSDKNDDDEIAIQQASIKVSLKCPILLTRMRMPVKGENCKHVDCFDLYGFLVLNKKDYPNWLCPHCNEECTSDTLASDLFFQNLLNTLPKNVTEVEFEQDHTNMKIAKEDNDDGDENSDEEDMEVKPTREKSIARATNNMEVIDLISDEEESSPIDPKRPRLS